MRVIALVFTILFALSVSPRFSTAQIGADVEPTWYVEGATGYFTPEGDVEPGYAVLVTGGRSLSTGFLVTGSVGMAHVYDRYGDRDPLLAGERRFATYYIFRAGFEYPIQLSERQSLSLGTGFVYERSYFTLVGGTVVRDGNGTVIGISGFSAEEVTPDYGGLYLTARYGYHFNPLEVGLRVDTHLLYYDGGGEFIVGPFVALRI
jgi:hypothetical protein